MAKELTKAQKELGKKIWKLYNQQRSIDAEIKRLQGKCKHPLLKYRCQGNTGNYDPSQDCYWTEFYCPLCDKRWDEDGQGYIPDKYPQAVQHDNYGREPWQCRMLMETQLLRS